jgi:hypothetical protein
MESLKGSGMHPFKLFVLFLVLSVSPTIFAQETTPEKTSTPEHVAGGESEESQTDSHDAETALKKRKLEIGMILTAGIFLLGMFLVVVTLIYGRRTRRQIAAGRGPSQVRDELWYLKNKSAKSSIGEQDESQEDTK